MASPNTLLAAAFGGTFLDRPIAYALTPKSPSVIQAVARGRDYLLTSKREQGALMETWGLDSLIALALVKAGADKNHAKVQAAVSAVGARGRTGAGYEAIYNSAAAIVFLTALDEKRYKREIAELLKSVLAMQRGHGGFSSTEGGAPLAMKSYSTSA